MSTTMTDRFTPADERYITVPDAAVMLGISSATMRRLLDEGRIPCIRPSSQRRVKVRDVLEYRDAHTQGAAVKIARVDDDPLRD